MFSASVITGTKPEIYEELNRQLRGLLSGERDFIANMSNASALISTSLAGLNWAGFYILKDGELVLGPFQGKPACVRIALGRGVCGTTAARQHSVIVKNVHEFPGHIACDSASQSEIVVPLICDGTLVGVLDLDSPQLSRFDEDDQLGLEEFGRILIASSEI